MTKKKNRRRCAATKRNAFGVLYQLEVASKERGGVYSKVSAYIEKAYGVLKKSTSELRMHPSSTP